MNIPHLLKSKAAFNFLSLTAMRACTALFAFILFVAVARTYGQSGLGSFSTVLNLFLIFQTLPLIGMGMFVIRDLAQNPSQERQYRTSMTLISLTVACCIALGLILFAYFSYAPSFLFPVALVGFSIVLGAPAVVDEAILVACQRMGTTSIIIASESALRTLGCLLVVHNGYHQEWLFLVFAVSRLGSTVAYQIILSGRFDSISWSHIINLLKASPAYLGIVVFGACMLRLDNTFLSLLGSMEAVGIYSAAYKLFEMFLSVVVIGVMALFPMVAQKFTVDNVSYKRFVHSFLLILIVGIPIALILATIAPFLMSTVYSSKYADSAPVFAILTITLVAYTLDRVFSLIVHSAKKPFLDTMAFAVGAGLFALLLWMMIPAWGVQGAAWASALAQLCVLAIRHYQIKKVFGWDGFFKKSSKIAIAGVFALLVFIWIGFSEKPLVSLLCALGTYCVLLALLRESLFLSVFTKAQRS